jgi:hypothetical protein
MPVMKTSPSSMCEAGLIFNILLPVNETGNVHCLQCIRYRFFYSGYLSHSLTARVWRASQKISRHAPVSFVVNQDVASLSPFATIYERKGHGNTDKYDYDAADSECIENHGSSPFGLTILIILGIAY